MMSNRRFVGQEWSHYLLADSLPARDINVVRHAEPGAAAEEFQTTRSGGNEGVEQGLVSEGSQANLA